METAAPKAMLLRRTGSGAPAVTGHQIALPNKEQGKRKYPIAYTQPWKGVQIAIENPVGSVRRGYKPDGTMWQTHMVHAYGEISNTGGVDGDCVDCFVGPDPEGAEFVYVVHQKTVGNWSKYDEDKCMIGFPSLAAAKAAFLANYDDPRFLGPITTMPVDKFVEKVRATKDAPAMIKSIALFLRPRS